MDSQRKDNIQTNQISVAVELNANTIVGKINFLDKHGWPVITACSRRSGGVGGEEVVGWRELN